MRIARNFILSACSGSRGPPGILVKVAVLALAAWVFLFAGRPPDRGAVKDKEPFGAVAVVIEFTEEDIELQAFVDGVAWYRVELHDPQGRKIFAATANRKLQRQDGMSEMYWASEPTHYLKDAPNFDGSIKDFLARFPEGKYAFEGITNRRTELEGQAVLTHVIPALPKITSPVSKDDDPLVVNRKNVVIEWKPVTKRAFGSGGVEILEYQVVIENSKGRTVPWVDGSSRRAVINVPGDITRLTVPPEFLAPNTVHEFEILAIEVSGNVSISAGSFKTGD